MALWGSQVRFLSAPPSVNKNLEFQVEFEVFRLDEGDLSPWARPAPCLGASAKDGAQRSARPTVNLWMHGTDVPP